MNLADTMVEIKNTTHTVLKNEDIENFLSKRQRKKLRKIEETISKGRRATGRSGYNEYYICNQDEPYASKVILEIVKGEMEKSARWVCRTGELEGLYR